MSYDEEQQKRERSRVVVQTPTARREVVQETVRYPAERRGYSTATIALVALTAIAATVVLMLFLTNPSDDSDSTNINVRASVPTQPTPYQAPVMVQTPMTQPTPGTIIIQQPAPAQPPVIIAPPPATSAAPTTSAPPPAAAEPPASKAGTDDLSLQQKVDKAFADDTEVAAANVFATVVNGRVRLSGTVASDALKQRAERLAYSIKGVLGVDNKLTVSPAP